MVFNYIKLARLHQPVGILLLLFPALWSIALAGWNNKIAIIFTLGAILMRSAGCIINDIIDRDLDRKVERTKDRPLASGQISLKGAIIFLIVLLAISLALLLQLNEMTIKLGFVSVIPVIAYPFMKRLIRAPQVFLGLTFNFGALMGYTAIVGELTLVPIILYLACIVWTIAYDTIYAFQDEKFDREIGIKSTAIAFGTKAPFIVSMLYGLHTLLLITATYMALQPEKIFLIGILLGYLQLKWQVITLDRKSSENCKSRFKSNALYGVIILLSLLYL